MPNHKVKAAPGVRGVPVRTNVVLGAGASANLTDAEYASVSSFISAGVLLDLGSTTDAVTTSTTDFANTVAANLTATPLPDSGAGSAGTGASGVAAADHVHPGVIRTVPAGTTGFASEPDGTLWVEYTP